VLAGLAEDSRLKRNTISSDNAKPHFKMVPYIAQTCGKLKYFNLFDLTLQQASTSGYKDFLTRHRVLNPTVQNWKRNPCACIHAINVYKEIVGTSTHTTCGKSLLLHRSTKIVVFQTSLSSDLLYCGDNWPASQLQKCLSFQEEMCLL
jgi:hypothetical protein